MMGKVKVLFVATEFAPGMIPFASSIINTLASDKLFDVDCICVNSGKKSYKPYVAIQNCIHIEYPSNKFIKLIYKFYPYKIIKKIQELTRKCNYDYIHFLTGDFSVSYYVKSLSDRSNLVYTVHDLHPHEIEKKSNFFFNILRMFILKGNRRLVNCIPTLTTCSNEQMAELRSLFPQKKVVFSHFPTLVTSQMIKGTKKVEELKDKHNYILFFGGINKYKGVDILIDMYQKSEKLKNTCLVIAGKGIQYNTYNNPNIVSINRFIDDDEISDLFRKSSVVVYPYRSATLSGVLSISLYYRKKIVVSRLPFFEQYNCNLIKYFETNDILQLEEKIIQQIKEKDIESSDYEQFFSSNVLIDDYRNLYSI